MSGCLIPEETHTALFPMVSEIFNVKLDSKPLCYSILVKELWNFSFDQHIKFDTPAVIDYVLNVTKRKNLAWVGHSQGTMIMFGLLSTSQNIMILSSPS